MSLQSSLYHISLDLFASQPPVIKMNKFSNDEVRRPDITDELKTIIILQYLGGVCNIHQIRFSRTRVPTVGGGGGASLRRLHPGIIAQINSIVNTHLSINWCFFPESFDFRFLSSPFNSVIVISHDIQLCFDLPFLKCKIQNLLTGELQSPSTAAHASGTGMTCFHLANRLRNTGLKLPYRRSVFDR